MAYEDEQRRRRSVQLTPEQKDWIIRAMAAQQAGQPAPPLPTRSVGARGPDHPQYVTPLGNERPAANQGREVLAPAYVDPKSQAIAQTPGIIRPAHSMLDKIFRPGRADAANQMNREYLENALKNQSEQQYNQARTSSLQQDAAIKELQRRAMDGDPKALESLKEFYKAEALRRGGGGRYDSDLYLQQLAQEGSIDAGGGDDAVRRERGESPPPRAPASGDTMWSKDTLTKLGSIADMTPTEMSQANDDEKIAELQKIVDTGMITKTKWRMGGDFTPSKDSVSVEEATPNQIAEARAGLKELQERKQLLRSSAERYSPTRATLE